MDNAVAPGMWVEIHYTLRDGRGNTLESSHDPDGDGPMSFVCGMGMVVPGLENALESAMPGEVLEITIPPEDGFGLRDPEEVFEVPKEEFPDPDALEVGAEFSAEGEDGTTLAMRVLEIHDDHVVVDANHPLAGETLNYQVQVLAVRPATSDEVLVAKAELAEAPSTNGGLS